MALITSLVTIGCSVPRLGLGRRASPARVLAVLTMVLTGAIVAEPAGALPEVHGVRHFEVTFTDAGRVTCRVQPCGPRVLPVSVTAPDDDAGPYPVVLFAHGFSSVPEHYATLLDHVAAAGFVVLAPRLPEARDDLPNAPTRTFTALQAGDLSFVLTQVEGLVGSGTDGWDDLASPARPTVMGHSDGGIIAAALVETSVADPRLAGAVVIAGEYDADVGPFTPRTPRTLVVHGTADVVAAFSGGQFLFDQAAAPKAFLAGTGRSHEGVVLDPDAGPARDAIAAWLGWVAKGDAGGIGRFWAAATRPGFFLQGAVGIDLSPIGAVETVTSAPPEPAPAPQLGTISITGWALDPDTPDPISVEVRIDGALHSSTAAALDRPDVAFFWKHGAAHGFDLSIDAVPGPREVCVHAVDVGPGSDRELDCRTVEVPPRSPNPPTDVVITPFSGSVAVRWTPRPAEEVVSSYILSCSCGPDRVIAAPGRSANLTGLPNGIDVNVTVRSVNVTATSAPSPTASTTPVDVPARVSIVTPVRVIDTREGSTPLGPGAELDVALPGAPGNAVGAIVSITALDPSEPTFLTVSPSGTGPGEVSSLNVQGGFGPVSNQLILPVGPDHGLTVFNNSGSVSVFVDLMGWMVGGAGAAGRADRTPTRIADTREPGGVPMGPGASRSIHVAEPGTVAASVVITSTGASADSFLTAWGAGAKPFTSIQNPRPGLARAANVVVPLDGRGDLHLFNNSGTVDIIVDLLATYAPGTAGPQRWHAQAPWRLADSRLDGGPLVPEVDRTVPGATATLQANLVATEVLDVAHLSAWSEGAWPGTSNLNVVPGLTVAQSVSAGGPGGLRLRASGPLQAVVDVTGQWSE